MTIAEYKRFAKKRGCKFHHEGTNHEIWLNPKNGNMFPIGRHDTQEVSKDLFHRMNRQAGIK
ncbi:MAG: type II toxin-antitoxin system HicA family toxin [Oscillospiraceae bacterium]|nr:type II toxin-antitoxin system HicA family toxin [Oscillospiraceae bacterium]